LIHKAYPNNRTEKHDMSNTAIIKGLAERIEREAPAGPVVPNGQVLLERKLAENCLSGMKYAVSWERDRDGRPPSQVCCFEIQDLEKALAASPQQAPQAAQPVHVPEVHFGKTMKPETLRVELQKMCSAWGAYWRGSDAHGVELTTEQAIELLQNALNVEVEIKDEDAEQQAAPIALPLSDEQIDAQADKHFLQMNNLTAYQWRTYARAIERAHGIKGD
jgi:hypothetical protein